MTCRKCELNNFRTTEKIEKKHCKECMSKFYINEAKKYYENKYNHPNEIVIDLTQAYQYSQINNQAVAELKKFFKSKKPLVQDIANSLTVKEIIKEPNVIKLNSALESNFELLNFPEISCIVKNINKNSAYRVSLNRCECKDFQIHKRPCKHMYFLALSLGLAETPTKKSV